MDTRSKSWRHAQPPVGARAPDDATEHGERGAAQVEAAAVLGFREARVGLAIVAADGRVEMANREIERIVGEPLESWLSLPTAVWELAAGRSSGAVHTGRGDARTRWSVTHADQRWVVQAEDVTAEHEKEQTLHVYDERLKAVGAVLNDIAQAEFDVEDVLVGILDRTRHLINASVASLGILEGDQIVYRFSAGGLADRSSPVQTPFHGSLSGISISRGETVRCDDAEDDPRVDIVACRRAALRSMIVVPLRHEGDIVGVLNAYSPNPHSFGDEDVHTIELIGGAIGAAYGHAVDLATKRGLLHEVKATVAALQQSEANLADRVLHDALTGLPNRTLFLDRLRQALAEAQRDLGKVAVLYVDVDYFKVVNDTLGHAAGDALLVEIAGRLSGCMREGDTVARFGGDEFTVCARGLREPGEASQLAERMSHAVAAPISLPGGRIATQVSIGISISGEAPSSAEQLLKEADSGLYRVKRLGRHDAGAVLSGIEAEDETRADLGAAPSSG